MRRDLDFGKISLPLSNSNHVILFNKEGGLLHDSLNKLLDSIKQRQYLFPSENISNK